MIRSRAVHLVLVSLLGVGAVALAPSRADADEPAVATPSAIAVAPETPSPPTAADGEPTTPTLEPVTDDEEPSALSPDAPDLGLFGIGLLLGQPIGATAKVFLAPTHALQFGLGFDLVYLDAAIVSVDYVWHPTPIFGNSVFLFTWHVGLGAALGVWPVGHDDDCRDADPVLEGVQPECRTAWVHPGVRVPLGLEMLFREAPLELFVEFAPGVFVYPEVGFLGQGGFGARWYL